MVWCLIIHLSATGVAEIDKSTNLKGCPHTFVYMVYMLHIGHGARWVLRGRGKVGTIERERWGSVCYTITQ